ncbi:flagellar hook-basal body complex protein [Helicobacter kayseriensis]|uniref:flagellar hook-basal body complex protein n=1 Tax=Helicobacter kayseriensis TaxID=2905877 RepID=UPI001E5AC294|nr:flagellar hook-basal body complex protein [Helicobacter kayseriensis]MCE3047073.1 flagellar hook-basal body complex protein [Helicobacter kayseriensis]MCE3048267.1 flagellar hook-basal body complex protein [Helicobacter kayseriensis]
MNNTILNSYSGIKTHQFGLDSVSNNIANVNTVGFRESRPEFETLFAPKTSSNGPTSNEINMGATAASNAISTQNGSYKLSDGEFDLAYQGKGWFVVGENKEGEMEVKKDSFSQKQENFFTRDGNFGKDAQGYLVNSRGYYVYGVNLGKIQNGVFISSPQDDEQNLASEKLSPLRIPQDLHCKPAQTTKVQASINLNKTQNPKNAYDAFVVDGKLDEKKILDADVNIFFANQKSLDSQINNEAKITLTSNDGKQQTYTFYYGEGKENSFRTLGELKSLIKEKTGLDLNIATQNTDSKTPSLAVELSSPNFAQPDIQTDGSFFEALGMNTKREQQMATVSPYTPNQSYAPNELVSYLGITFKKINQAGNSNPLESPKDWEIVGTNNVKNFDENKTYSAGDVVKKDGSVYLMDDKNQFLKISDEKTFQYPTYNPQEQYGKNTFVQFENKLYERIGETGNSNPAQDPEGWQEISLGKILSKSLEVPHFTSNIDIYDENGKKYHLISQYNLVEGFNTTDQKNQKWEVKTYIQDIESKNRLGDEVTHFISFDQDNQPTAQTAEIDFKGKKIAYDIAGTEKEKSSDELYSESRVVSSSQNGYPDGLLEQTSINENGVIFLKFSNGKQEAMGRIGVVAFVNDQGLSKMGGNLFGLESTLIGGEKHLKSGNPILGWNESGKLTMGNIKQGYLETSNVNVGNALTELILMQRGYSMNAKSFTTGDELIKEAINLKK